MASILYLRWVEDSYADGKITDEVAGSTISAVSTLITLLGVVGLTTRSRWSGLVLIGGAAAVGGWVLHLLDVIDNFGRTPASDGPLAAAAGAAAIGVSGVITLLHSSDPSPPAPVGGRPTPVPPGWYEDPFSTKRLRYWTGAQWTKHKRTMRPLPPPRPVQSPPDEAVSEDPALSPPPPGGATPDPPPPPAEGGPPPPPAQGG